MYSNLQEFVDWLNNGVVKFKDELSNWEPLDYSKINEACFYPSLRLKYCDFSLQGGEVFLTWVSQETWDDSDLGMFQQEVRRFFDYHEEELRCDVVIKVSVYERENSQHSKFKFSVKKKVGYQTKFTALESYDDVISPEGIDGFKEYLYGTLGKGKEFRDNARVVGGKMWGIAKEGSGLFKSIDIGRTFHYATDAIYKYFWVGEPYKECLELISPMDNILAWEDKVPCDLSEYLGEETQKWVKHEFEDVGKNIFTEKLIRLFGESGNNCSGLYCLTMMNEKPVFLNKLYREYGDRKAEYLPVYGVEEGAVEAVEEVIRLFGDNVKEVLFLAERWFTFDSDYVYGYYSTTCEDGEELIVVY